MTQHEQNALVGKPASLNAGTIEECRVIVKRVGRVFGNMRALVRNANNGQEKMVSLNRLTFDFQVGKSSVGKIDQIIDQIQKL